MLSLCLMTSDKNFRKKIGNKIAQPYNVMKIISMTPSINGSYAKSRKISKFHKVGSPALIWQVVVLCARAALRQISGVPPRPVNFGRTRKHWGKRYFVQCALFCGSLAVYGVFLLNFLSFFVVVCLYASEKIPKFKNSDDIAQISILTL